MTRLMRSRRRKSTGRYGVEKMRRQKREERREKRDERIQAIRVPQMKQPQIPPDAREGDANGRSSGERMRWPAAKIEVSSGGDRKTEERREEREDTRENTEYM